MDNNKKLGGVYINENYLLCTEYNNKPITEECLNGYFYSYNKWLDNVNNIYPYCVTIIEKDKIAIFNNCILTWCDNLDKKNDPNDLKFTIVMVE